MDAPWNVTYRDGPDRFTMRFDTREDAEAYAKEQPGILWFKDEFIADYEDDD